MSTTHECEPWQLQDSAQGGKYCAACGKPHPAETRNPACDHPQDEICDTCEPPYRCYGCKRPVTMCEIQCQDCLNSPPPIQLDTI